MLDEYNFGSKSVFQKNVGSKDLCPNKYRAPKIESPKNILHPNKFLAPKIEGSKIFGVQTNFNICKTPSLNTAIILFIPTRHPQDNLQRLSRHPSDTLLTPLKTPPDAPKTPYNISASYVTWRY